MDTLAALALSLGLSCDAADMQVLVVHADVEAAAEGLRRRVETAGTTCDSSWTGPESMSAVEPAVPGGGSWAAIVSEKKAAAVQAPSAAETSNFGIRAYSSSGSSGGAVGAVEWDDARWDTSRKCHAGMYRQPSLQCMSHGGRTALI